MYKLIIEDDEGKTTVVPLIRDEITIGRKEGNTIRLTERNVSRRHAKLLKSNGAVYIEDLQSYNGIKVNGEKIVGRAAINEGDRVQIGDYQLALKIERQADVDGGDGDKTTPWPKDGGLPANATAATRLTPQLSAKPAEEKPAKVVAVSSNFAGQEFSLDKPTMVIGRTDDNDIVINHRSISRHHAQIIREAGHYHIVDMGSANGVRVNGEDYGKVELRKGDHIDLGHVRLRFVAPGEDFIFIRDAEVIDVNAGGKSKGGAGMIAAIVVGVAVVVGGAIVYKLVSKGSDPESQVAKLALDADNQIAARNWDSCIATCDRALAISPGQTSVQDKKHKCEDEKETQAKFEKFSKDVNDGKYKAAVLIYEDIPDTSVYKAQATEIFKPVKKLYVMQELDEARKAPNCSEATSICDGITIIDPTNADCAAILKTKCGGVTPPPRPAHGPRTSLPHVTEPAATHSSPVAETTHEPAHTAPTPEPVHAPVVETPKPAPPAAGGGPVETVDKAFGLYMKGQYPEALALASSVKGQAGSLPDASRMKMWKVIGAASCFTNNREQAVAAYNRLDQNGRQFVMYVCHKNSIDLQ